MIAYKIKILREKFKLTQSELAKELNLTRSAVNSWEMGVTTPSVGYIIKLARLFNLSTDYILDMPQTKTIAVDGLSDREVASLVEIVNCYKNKT